MIHPRATANVPPAAFPDGRPAAPPRPAQGVSRRSSAARIGAQTTTGGVVVVADSAAIGSSSALPDRRLDHRPHSPRSTGRALLAAPLVVVQPHDVVLAEVVAVLPADLGRCCGPDAPPLREHRRPHPPGP